MGTAGAEMNHECDWMLSPLTLGGQEYYPPAPAPEYRPDLRSNGRNQKFNDTFKVEVCRVCGTLRVPPDLLPRLVDSIAIEWKDRRKRLKPDVEFIPEI
jgi:hypothetical protein